LTPGFDSAVPMTLLSHATWSYTKFNFHWLSSVNGTAKIWLSGANNNAEFWLSGATDIAESWLSDVIGDLKLEYLGELDTVLANTLGPDSVA
jgi:hypothetical protein